jgi:hypothetical protein
MDDGRRLSDSENKLSNTSRRKVRTIEKNESVVVNQRTGIQIRVGSRYAI